MWSNKFFIVIIVVLLGFNLYITYRFIHLNQQINVFKRIIDAQPNYALNTYETNFITNMINDGLRLDDFEIRNSVGNIISLKSAFKQGQNKMLVYRFSETHCESCVSSSLLALRNWVDSIGVRNIIFLGQHRNNAFVTQLISSYDIPIINTYNVAGLNIPVEELGYPYYFVLNSDLQVSSIFVPNRETPAITETYLRTIKDKISPAVKVFLFPHHKHP